MCKSEIRVLMLGPSLDSHGGIASVVNSYFASDLENQVKLTYIPTVSEGTRAHKLLCALRAFKAFQKTISRHNIVHIHISDGMSFYRKSMFVRFANAAGVPVVLHSHDGSLADTFSLATEATKRRIIGLFQRASRVVVLSEEWRKFFAENICDLEKISVIYNAVPVPLQAAKPEKSDKILFLGRLAKRKSPDILLEAFALIRDKYPESSLVIAGDGDIHYYKSLAEKLGIAESVYFPGWVASESRDELFLNCGLMCLPSKNEGMPMSILESMSWGVPVVSTPVGGIPKLIHNGVNGYLFPVDDVPLLAEKLSFLLGNKELRRKMGCMARLHIKKNFSVDANTEKLIKTYESILFDGGYDNYGCSFGCKNRS